MHLKAHPVLKLIILGCLVVAPNIYADDYLDLVPDVFQSVLVYPQPKGSLQIGTFPTFQKNPSSDTSLLPLELLYGATDNWQFTMNWNGYEWLMPKSEPSTEGITDLDVGTEYSWMHIKNSLYSAAAEFDIQFPTGNIHKGLTEGFIQYEPLLVFARDIKGKYPSQIFTNIAVTFVQRTKQIPNAHGQGLQELPQNNASGILLPGTVLETPESNPAAHLFILGLADVTAIDKIWRVTAELNWQTNTWNHHGTDDELYFTPGIIANLNDSFSIGLGTPVGLNKGADDYRVIGLLTYQFNLPNTH